MCVLIYDYCASGYLWLCWVLLSLDGLLEFLLHEGKEEEGYCRCCCIKRNSRMVE